MAVGAVDGVIPIPVLGRIEAKDLAVEAVVALSGDTEDGGRLVEQPPVLSLAIDGWRVVGVGSGSAGRQSELSSGGAGGDDCCRRGGGGEGTGRRSR